MADNYIREFAKECISFKDAMRMYDRTMKVYDFLKTCTEPLSPTEIAERLTEISTLERDYYKRYWYKEDVTNPLHWLLGMGLVGREEYKTTIHIDTYGHYRIDRKVIDGQTYIAKVWTDGGFDKEVTLYKWYAK